ncbi:hypothetical protein GAY28_32505 [Azospirillum brasilense]|nr:hypothetical protein [Azospirillum brasilense]
MIDRHTRRHADGRDPGVKVEVTVPGHQPVRLVCRQIAGFGGVINPLDGGILKGNRWDQDGKGGVRAVSPARLSAVAYLAAKWPS